MTRRLTLRVDGPFSLAAAASFGFGPHTGRPAPGASLMRLAFAADDLRHHVGAVLTQQPDGSLTAEVSGDGPAPEAEAQIRRILSIDTSVAGWLEAVLSWPRRFIVGADDQAASLAAREPDPVAG